MKFIAAPCQNWKKIFSGFDMVVFAAVCYIKGVRLVIIILTA